jgi:hypothetical protein
MVDANENSSIRGLNKSIKTPYQFLHSDSRVSAFLFVSYPRPANSPVEAGVGVAEIHVVIHVVIRVIQLVLVIHVIMHMHPVTGGRLAERARPFVRALAGEVKFCW